MPSRALLSERIATDPPPEHHTRQCTRSVALTARGADRSGHRLPRRGRREQRCWGKSRSGPAWGCDMTEQRFIRRPKWFQEGQDPDYRFTLANERTFLAWIRTSLALLAAAVALVQLVP